MVKKEMNKKELTVNESVEELVTSVKVKSRAVSKRDTRSKSELGSRKGNNSSRKSLKSVQKLELQHLKKEQVQFLKKHNAVVNLEKQELK